MMLKKGYMSRVLSKAGICRHPVILSAIHVVLFFWIYAGVVFCQPTEGRLSPADVPLDILKPTPTINIHQRGGSGAPVVIADERLDDGAIAFQSSYSTARFSGDVKAYALEGDSGDVNIKSPLWSAGARLNERRENRLIATYNGRMGVPFRYDMLTDKQRVNLSPDVSKARGIVDYLRGDRRLEQGQGGAFRDRTSLLGTVVHSAPYFLKGVLYVGANDGMMHAFNAKTGNEVFAYVPGQGFLLDPSTCKTTDEAPCVSYLSTFTDPQYSHRSFVDATPHGNVAEGKVLLAGTLGMGGKGCYCLNITDLSPLDGNPLSISDEIDLADRVEWEYPRERTTMGEVNDLGMGSSRAWVVNSNADEGWVVVFGNGYDSPNGRAVLFIVHADTGALLTRIDTGIGPDNGLSTPVLTDVNNDYRIDYAYAGDLKGNLWKFDLTSIDIDQWDVAYKSLDGNPAPLFQALGSDGKEQPITGKPDVMRHCEDELPGYLVVFGTGKYFDESDLTDTSPQTIYGIWDYGDDSDDSEYLGSFSRGGVKVLSNQPNTVTLLEQTQFFFDYVSKTDGSLIKLRVLSHNRAVWDVEADDNEANGEKGNPSPIRKNHAGWFYDLPEAGERVIQEVIIRDGKAIVISQILSSNGDQAEGESIIHEMDACTGARLDAPVFEITNDQLINERDFIIIPNPDSPDQTIMVAPTGIYKAMVLYMPEILPVGVNEIKYFSTGTGDILTVQEKSERKGVYYWKQLE